MQPAGNAAYDEANVWSREGLVSSEELLEDFADHVTTFLRIELDEVARAAHVHYVTRGNGSKGTREQPDRFKQVLEQRFVRDLVTSAQDPEVWRGLHQSFRALVQEESSLVPRNSKDQCLRAHVDYKNGAKYGVWSLSEGINENLRGQFEVEATRAGIALGSVLHVEPVTLWLHYVFSDLLANHSKLLLSASKDGGIIVRVPHQRTQVHR